MARVWVRRVGHRRPHTPCAGAPPLHPRGPVCRSHCPLRQWGVLPRARPADSPEKESGATRGAGVRSLEGHAFAGHRGGARGMVCEGR